MKNQIGTFYLWFSVIIPVLLLIVAFLYFNVNRSSLRVEMQMAADAAAVAGAKILCSRRDCYSDSRTAAINILNQFLISTHVGRNNIQLEGEPNADRDGDSVNDYWSYPEQGVDVWINRGMWVENHQHINQKLFDCEHTSAAEYCFESMEGNWQKHYPGIPVSAVANAIEIKIETKLSPTFNYFFALDNFNMHETAVALSGTSEEVPVAPFALPVCALLDTTGEFQKDELCRADRVFTAVDRFKPDVSEFESFGNDCIEIQSLMGHPPGSWANWYPELRGSTFPAGANAYVYSWQDFGYSSYDDCLAKRSSNQSKFGVRPTFFYGPCSNNIRECNINRMLNTAYLKPVADTYEAYGWSNYGLENFADHYGLVGSTNSNYSSESSLANNLSALTAKIGQEFYFIQQGFKSTSSAELLWQQIINSATKAVDTDIGSLSNYPGKIAFSTNYDVGLESKYVPPYNYSMSSYYQSSFYNLFAYTYNSQKIGPNYNWTIPATSPFYIPYRRFPSPYIRNLKRDYITDGICRSRRMSLGCRHLGTGNFVRLEDIANPDVDCRADLNYFFNYDALTLTAKDLHTDHFGNNIELSVDSAVTANQDNVWQIRIPIVADPTRVELNESGEQVFTCQGINDQTFESAIANNTRFVVVGFNLLNIFDLDIGDFDSNPQSKQAPFSQVYKNNYSKSTLLTYSNPYTSIPPYQYYEKTIEGAYADISQYNSNAHFANTPWPWNGNVKIRTPYIPTGEPDSDGNPSFTGPNPWYLKVDGQVRACNLVRARIDCATDYIPSSDFNTGEGRIAKIVQ